MARRSTGPSPTEAPGEPASVARIVHAHPGVKAHRRFALHEVTLGGLPVGGATVDAWYDGGDAQRWSARLLIPVLHPLREGILAGTASGGERLSGQVHLGGTTAGPRRGRDVLVEFHGDGPLLVEAAQPG
ncbi:MAG TPA: hypothetical protein VET90_04095 [Candidatus Binatus sp.]|nr:hypothetical protein [Candidatus Binatus sp.]